jgi:hypothetical protein
VIVVVRRLKFVEADICTESRNRDIVFGSKVTAIGWVAGAIPAGFKNFAFLNDVQDRITY